MRLLCSCRLTRTNAANGAASAPLVPSDPPVVLGIYQNCTSPLVRHAVAALPPEQTSFQQRLMAVGPRSDVAVLVSLDCWHTCSQPH